jgi:hypothetical protein
MRRLLFLVALGCCSGGALAHGQVAPSLEGLLSVQPDPSGCIDEPALRARVRHWLAPRALVPAAGVRVRVHADPVAFSVQRDGRNVARREFAVLPVQCANRLDALALAIAVALEHLAREQPSAFAASGAPPAPAAGTVDSAAREADQAAELPATDDVASRDPRAASRASIRYGVLAHASLWVEALPETAAAFGLGLELGIDRWRFAAIALASTQTDTALADGRAQARFFGGRAQACLSLTAFAPELQAEPCAGLIAGVVPARGDGFPVERRATFGYVAALLRLALRYPAQGMLSLRIAIDGLLNASRPELQVTGASSTSDSTALFGAAPSIELLVELP